MGRAKKSRSLTLWMNGERVGYWRLPAAGRQEFLYAESWLGSSSARPISLSLPLRPSHAPYRENVESFFDNLLPDNRQIRERIQRRFQTASLAPFDLLQEVGRDCVGALQLLPEGEPPPDVRRITGEVLTPTGVEQVLAGAIGSSMGQQENEDAFRLSLAGAQEKTALLWHEGQWHRPTGTTPTTHILKLPIGISPLGIDLSTSVENEWLCAQIVRAYGIDVAACRMETFGAFKTLIVERFDRRLSPDRTWWMRLPQEDFCQATGTPPALKYENEGGPGIQKIMDLLLGSEQSTSDRHDFIRTQLVFWLLAGIDGHAKNFSVFLLPGGGFRLTPRNEVLSAHPMLGHGRCRLSPEKITMAMALEGKNRHYRWSGIRLRHWLDTAKRCGVPKMENTIREVIDQTPVVLADVRKNIPSQFPGEVADAVLRGVQAAAKQLAEEVAALSSSGP